MPYSLAIFDLDGTLADSFPWFLSVLDRVADEFHLKRVRAEDIPALRDVSSVAARDVGIDSRNDERDLCSSKRPIDSPSRYADTRREVCFLHGDTLNL